MPLHSKAKLIFKFNNPEYRKAFVSSRIDNGLAFQIRVMRQGKGWSQAEFAKKLGTSQNAVFRMENPAYGKQSLTTLKKIAEIFDVGLTVRFISFSQLVDLTTSMSTEDVLVPSFAEDQALRSEANVQLPSGPEGALFERSKSQTVILTNGDALTHGMIQADRHQGVGV